MESQDLYLSREEVRVVYRFRNRSDRDIATLVAFPLPSMIIGEEGNYDFYGRDPVNVMSFQLTVDGKTVEPEIEVKATRFGVDVTDVLQRYDIPQTMIAARRRRCAAGQARQPAASGQGRARALWRDRLEHEFRRRGQAARQRPLGHADHLLLVPDLSRGPVDRGHASLQAGAR